ncbi:MAG TPA: class I SAM-dependent methyltransferase [Acidimicrobiales bacterium]|nr:class I SAM-dependent methyltransferase [Acidimicrobiales bacterium]
MSRDAQPGAPSHSFGQIALDYDRYRPAPPSEALSWLLPEAAHDVLEIGAGTGLLTRQLVARATTVRALEPDPRMREVLAARAPGAEVLAGYAEALPVADASVDCVIASSAWHWVDEERAVPEVARVLRPGGYLSLLWNGPDRNVPWVRGLWAGGQDLSEEQATVVDARRRERHQVHLGARSSFHHLVTRMIRWSSEVSKPDLIGWVGTYSAVLTMEATERSRYLEAVARYLAAHEPEREVLTLPMRCLCWRATRL